jgi:hypothetical protein
MDIVFFLGFLDGFEPNKDGFAFSTSLSFYKKSQVFQSMT